MAQLTVPGRSINNARNEAIVQIPPLSIEVFRGWVGMFDFLGFTELLRNTEGRLGELLQEYEIETDLIISFLLPDFAKRHNGRVSRVERLRYADTVVLYTRGTTGDEFKEILAVACALLAASIGRGLPLRGALTAGELGINAERKIFTGAGLIRAHDLETNQRWAGGALDTRPLSTAEFPPALRDECLASGLLAACDIPLKQPHEGVLALAWPTDLHITTDTLTQRLHRLHPPKDADQEEKLANTLAFFDAQKLIRPTDPWPASYEAAVHHRSGRIWLPI